MRLVGLGPREGMAFRRLLRTRRWGVNMRLPAFVLPVSRTLMRRNRRSDLVQVFAAAAGFGRLPLRVPGAGRMLPGFRHLGAVALLGVALHYALWQTGLRARRTGPRQAGPAAAGRVHRQGDGTLPYWLRAGANRKLPRPDSSA